MIRAGTWKISGAAAESAGVGDVMWLSDDETNKFASFDFGTQNFFWFDIL